MGIARQAKTPNWPPISCKQKSTTNARWTVAPCTCGLRKVEKMCTCECNLQNQQDVFSKRLLLSVPATTEGSTAGSEEGPPPQAPIPPPDWMAALFQLLDWAKPLSASAVHWSCSADRQSLSVSSTSSQPCL